MDYIRIRNWERWQSYRKDRGQPPWIKIHRRLMRNPEWVSLSDAERGQLVVMWLLAADQDGVIPASSCLVEKLCYMSSPLDLNKFAELGFLEPDDVNVTSERRQHDHPEAEAEAETETETEAESDRAGARVIDIVPISIETKKKNVRHTYSAEFARFWDVYPKRRAKKTAYRAWKRARAVDSWPGVDAIIDAVEQQKRSKQWRQNNGQYIPHPSTWLNGGCWEDEQQEKGSAYRTVIAELEEQNEQRQDNQGDSDNASNLFGWRD